MSRRAKRKAAGKNKNSRSGSGGTIALRLLVGLMIIAALGSVASYIWLRSYLGSVQFRQVILTKMQDVLKAEAALSPLRWDGFQVSAERAEASSRGPLRQLLVEGVRTGVDASGVIRGVWSVSPSRVTKLTVAYDSTIPPVDQEEAGILSSDQPTKQASAPWYAGWMPKKVETEAWVINSSDFQFITSAGVAQMKGVRWDVEPTDRFDQIKMTGSSGKIRLPYEWAPELSLEKMKLSYQKESLFLTQASLRAYQNGKLEVTGELQPETKQYALEGEIADLSCSEVLPADWKQRLSGKMKSSFVLRSSETNPSLKGHLVIEQGLLTALPILDKLAAYSQSVRFRTLTLHTAECDYDWSGNRLELSNIQLGSEGLARLEGKLVLSRQDASLPYQIRGDLRLGLAPGTLSEIPGAEEDVFVAAERGLLWAPLQVTGTLDALQEDLSQRLIAAAGVRMFEIIPATGLKVLKYTQQVMGGATEANASVIPKVIDQASKTLRQGTDVIDQATKGATGLVGGIVQGLLGGDAAVSLQEADPKTEQKRVGSAPPSKSTEPAPPAGSKTDAAE